MPRILVTPAILIGVRGPYVDLLEGAGFEVVFPPAELSLFDADALVGQLEGIDGVLASVEPYTADVLSRTNLRVIARHGVGYDAVDVAAATGRAVVLTTTPGTNEQSVAETAVAMMMAVMRGYPQRDQFVRAGRWERSILPRLVGKTLGLVGLGRIGKAVVPKAQGLGMSVIAYDPYPDEAFAAEHDVRYAPLDELLATSDVVSLHLPCTAETENLINAQTLAQMKTGSVLVNTARGGLVDEAALVESLRGGHLMAAALDVFQQEPLPANTPLVELDNLLLSPHCAGADDESVLAMRKLAARCLVDLHEGRWPEECIVNRELAPGWKW